jgi:hypothetical protein
MAMHASSLEWFPGSTDPRMLLTIGRIPTGFSQAILTALERT